jgi:hypothetical protein
VRLRRLPRPHPRRPPRDEGATVQAAAIFPTPVRPRADPRLLRAIAQALADLGDIDLPDTAPTAEDAHNLEALGPLYLASELEQAGLLRTAELVAGLFASGSITQPLGPTAQLIAKFWQGRRERLSAEERQHLFAQVFDPAGFYPLMQALCTALAGTLDTPPRPGDVHAQVQVREAADTLGGWLAPHAAGMAQFAANDIVGALSQATHFLRDRMLQAAFGVHDLWGLVEAVGRAQGTSATQARQRVELGRHGADVLSWLAGAVTQAYAFDPASAAGQQLMTSAEGWLMAWSALDVHEQPRDALAA